MSELATVYGCIEGASGRSQMWNALHLWNYDVINALPAHDEWPPLNSGMFAVPMGDGTRMDFYRVQMIHFGASFNHFSDAWSTWLEKFENLAWFSSPV